VDQIIRGGLHAYLDERQQEINEIDKAVLSDFVDRHPRAATVGNLRTLLIETLHSRAL
jgi:hypothetical protein